MKFWLHKLKIISDNVSNFQIKILFLQVLMYGQKNMQILDTQLKFMAKGAKKLKNINFFTDIEISLITTIPIYI